MTLSNTLKAGIVATSLGLAGLTGCANNSEGKKGFSLEVLLKGAAVVLKRKGKHREASAIKIIGRLSGKIGDGDYAREEVRERKAKKRRIERERSRVTVTTPGGDVDLEKYLEVMYNGKPYLVQEINPPNISIFEAFPINENKFVCSTFTSCSYIFPNFPNTEGFHQMLTSRKGDKFYIGRKKRADVVGMSILNGGKLYFDPEEGKGVWEYDKILIKDLDMFKE